MGKRHSDKAVLNILQRKGLYVNPLTKQIGLPSDVQIGIRVLGKLDFMRNIYKWQIIKNAGKGDVGLGGKTSQQYANSIVGSNKKTKKDSKDTMKETFKKKQAARKEPRV